MGIDPGLEGAVITLNKFGTIVDWFKMPLLEIKEKRTINLDSLSLSIKAVGETFPKLLATIEKNHSAPEQGVASMFSMGYNAGVVEMSLACHKVSYQCISAQKWKNSMMSGCPKEKDASVVEALKLFPKSADILITKRGRRDHNIADALLIAEWARRQFITG